MKSSRQTAVVAGVFFIVAAAAAIVGLALEGPVLYDARYIVGGPLIFASGTAEMFGPYQQISVWGSIGALPVFAWEMSLAVWLIVKGFRDQPLRAALSS